MLHLDTEILKAISCGINKAAVGLKADMTFPSVVYEAHCDGTYTIKKDGQDYKVKNGLGTALSPGQHVWVKLPMNKLEFMHICGIR